MKLNDPFNRLHKKQQSEYNSFRKTLNDNSIKTRTDATLLIKNINIRALYFTLIILGISAMVILILPEFKVMVSILSALTLLWVFSSTFKGKMYLRRYINEELSDKQ